MHLPQGPETAITPKDQIPCTCLRGYKLQSVMGPHGPLASGFTDCAFRHGTRSHMPQGVHIAHSVMALEFVFWLLLIWINQP